MPAGLSGVANGIAVQNFQLQVGNGGSPEVFTAITNIADYEEPLTAETADVTNVAMTWRARIATLLDMGKIKFKIFWVMEDPTQENAISGSVRGLRYLYYNRILANYKAIYPDSNSSTDFFPAYVTSFSITGKVGGVFEATIELSNNGQPNLQ